MYIFTFFLIITDSIFLKNFRCFEEQLGLQVLVLDLSMMKYMNKCVDFMQF